MVTPRTVLTKLKHYDQYMQNIPRGQQRSAWFEDLIARTFSQVFHLPYFNRNNDDTSIAHRVVWNGIPNCCASGNGADGIIYAHEFYSLIEPTLKHGALQWAQEFASALRHYNNFVREQGLERDDVYLLLVTPEIFVDTYESFKTKQHEGYNLVLIEVQTLITMLETARLAFTIRHLELRKLFRKLKALSASSSSLQHYKETTGEYMKRWRDEVLHLEKQSFLAIKSYEAMKEILRGRTRNHVSIEEIKIRLRKDPTFKQYTALINEPINTAKILACLRSESLGYRIDDDCDDPLFVPVPIVEYKSRFNRKLKVVEAAR